MMRVVLLFFVGLFFFSENVSAMDTTQFRVLEDLSQKDHPTVRRQLKRGFTEIVLGGGLVVFSPYVPSLGSKHTSYSRDESTYDLLSPTNVKVFGKTLVLDGARKFASAAYEEYNIFRGSRLPPNERTLSLNIRNGIVDVGLASLIYLGHQYIPSLLRDSYIELAGPAVTVVAVSGLALRGLTELAKDVPTWASDLDWTSAAHSLKEKASPMFQRFKETCWSQQKTL
ncbi:MAG: hypothetical protein H0X26_01660 [Alphaproteobacteria bacterium]|nr:hypothetical protein [Alphaproteobacteria bacterium]